ncbi:tripartite motif-containing protein 64-like [Sciurus carolinensis]|uniref:tripartite motif-containing protein 64-like n=1 Tax=Sciurus carolinensis TaxID=30640 RepID=UPI001FB3B82E|nr:tripartite motif-containing protein 64-like [Sciurus carolinensis]
MDSHIFQEFQSELTCSICMNYFLDPVTIDCGHSFCRPCLWLCWDEAQTPRCCPECREITDKADFSTNIVLKKLASLARQATPRPDSSSGEQLCTAHREAQETFSDVDKSLLCAPYSDSPEHAVHSHSPSPESWVAEECRDKLLKKMDSLWKMTQEMQDNLNEEVSKSLSFLEYMDLRKNMIQAQYQMMHQFLFEEEQFQLVTLGRQAEEILQELRDSKIRMVQYREKLKEMYRELTEMCHKPDMELLQVSREGPSSETELVQRQKPHPVNPELSSLHITGLLDMLNHFRVNNGTIQGWANHYMSLSEEVRNMIFGDDGATEDPQSVESYAAWGAEAFTSGRHYWEVDVAKASNWVLGVCKDSMTRDNFEGEKAFLLFSLKKNNHYSLSTNSPSVTHFVQRPQGRVGVFLDYDNATMSFYDVCRGSLICTFFPSPFTSPLKPFLCLGSP